MQTDFIAAEECCVHYNIELSFIQSLQDYELIELNIIEEKTFIHTNQLHDLEKFIHLHYDLNINMEGIDAIQHLLLRMKRLQDEINYMKTHAL